MARLAPRLAALEIHHDDRAPGKSLSPDPATSFDRRCSFGSFEKTARPRIRALSAGR
jgi:hypothetical protein